MNIYKINSDVINDYEFVVAPSVEKAVETYVNRYAGQHVTEKSVTKIERIAENCLISEK